MKHRLTTFPLETDRLILRRIEIGDTAALYAYRSLDEVGLYQSWHPVTLDDAAQFIQKMLEADLDQADQWIQLAVCLKNGIMIGDIGIHWIDEHQAELGYTLSPVYQHQGYAYEAVSTVIDFLFTQAHKHRITASVDPANVKSIALLKKLGFRKEGHFKKSYFINGEWFDDELYAILEEEWKSNH